MSASRQEIFDSDDDGDNLSPLSDLLDSPQRLSPSALHEDSSRLEPVELPEQPAPSRNQNLLHSIAPAASTSTDPSFFRDIYEEQQRAADTQLRAATNEYDSQSKAGVTQTDPWEVPSSPLEVVGQQRESYLKRKWNDERQRARRSTVPNQPDEASIDGGSEPPTKQQRLTKDYNARYREMGLETSALPDPLTPSRPYQHPQLTSSSIDNSFCQVPHVRSLPENADRAADEKRHDGMPPVETVTQSTIAFTTPSIYASSGRRAVESSGHNLDFEQPESSHPVNLTRENDIVAARSATSPRQSRKTVELMQLTSSPDIIAGPVSMQKPRRLQSPVDHLQSPGGVKSNAETACWDMQTSRRAKTAKIASHSTHAQSKRMRFAEDELSIDAGSSTADMVTHNRNISGASHDSPQTKAVRKPKSRQRKKKAVSIAALEDDESDGREAVDRESFASVGSESDISDARVGARNQAKTNAKKRLKKGQKTKDPVAKNEKKKSKSPSDFSTKTDQDKPGREAQETVTSADRETAERLELAVIQADSASDTKAVPAQITSEPGKRVTKRSQERVLSNFNTNDGFVKANGDDMAHGITSGTAIPSVTRKDTCEKNEDVANEMDDKTDKDEFALRGTKANPETTGRPPPGTTSALSNASLNNAGLGRVPYRVGLSKKFRIAPLLKVMRK
ncbi:hypothetical protein SEPCBS119000_001169 [Sporothrix epigloea]|uniref:Uncharacterized protein n=1 Tax=Sporothrix epigloea TaxID=1892477 RepID=A0ABP0DA99_9PEZI